MTHYPKAHVRLGCDSGELHHLCFLHSLHAVGQVRESLLLIIVWNLGVSSFSIAVIKTMIKATLKRKDLTWLMVAEVQSPIAEQRRSSIINT